MAIHSLQLVVTVIKTRVQRTAVFANYNFITLASKKAFHKISDIP